MGEPEGPCLQDSKEKGSPPWCLPAFRAVKWFPASWEDRCAFSSLSPRLVLCPRLCSSLLFLLPKLSHLGPAGLCHLASGVLFTPSTRTGQQRVFAKCARPRRLWVHVSSSSHSRPLTVFLTDHPGFGQFPVHAFPIGPLQVCRVFWLFKIIGKVFAGSSMSVEGRACRTLGVLLTLPTSPRGGSQVLSLVPGPSGLRWLSLWLGHPPQQVLPGRPGV